MKTINKISIIALLSILLVSCTKIVEFNGEMSDPKIVVNSIFSNDTSLWVNITTSRFFLDNAPITSIDNATVSVYKNGDYVADMIHSGEGNYGLASLIPQPNVTYSLKVTAPDKEEVTCEASFPTPIHIVSIDTIYDFDQEYWNNSYLIKLKIDDPAGEKNYYRISVYADRYIYQESGPIEYMVYRELPWIWSDDVVLTGGGEEETDIFDSEVYNEYKIFDDTFFDGNEYTLDFNMLSDFLIGEEEENYAMVFFVLETLSEEYFTYLRSKTVHQSSSDDFFSEPVPIYSNIQGGIGYFGGYSMDVDSLRFESIPYNYGK